MAAKLASRWCYRCERMVKAEWSGANHILHLLLSVVSFGLWLPVWFIMSLNGSYHCTQCGTRVREHKPPSPRKKGAGGVATRLAGLAAGLVVAGIALAGVNEWLQKQEFNYPGESKSTARLNVNAASQQQPARPATPKRVRRNWSSSLTQSKISDRTNVVLRVVSNETINCGWNRGQRIEVLIYCSENKTSLILNTGCHMTSDLPGYEKVIWRLDKDRARTLAMTESTDNKALGLWGGGQSIPVIRGMMQAKSLVVQATPYNESPFTATFNIAGLSSAIKPVRQHCGW